jgi:putative oxidoreductase
MSTNRLSLAKFLVSHESLIFRILRISIAIVFIWFGALKIAGFNPVYDLIYYSMVPMFAAGTGLIALGIFETVLGLMLLTNRHLNVTHTLLVLHLLGTFSTFIFGWHVVFDPYFPVLSLAGEFVVKNTIIVMAGLVVLLHEARRQKHI